MSCSLLVWTVQTIGRGVLRVNYCRFFDYSESNIFFYWSSSFSKSASITVSSFIFSSCHCNDLFFVQFVQLR